MEKTAIGDRFKRYEQVTDLLLTKRTPVIARIDGRAFHTLTRQCAKPFDWRFFGAMAIAAQALCEEIQGCKMAYVQSDEISLLLCDYDRIESEAWFDYRLQKMCSVAASIASTHFTREFEEEGHFDARFFNVPENDVVNYFIWRQRDAERNSLQMLAQSMYSPRELEGKKTADLHELLHQKAHNWDLLQPVQKRGAAVIKNDAGWYWDEDTPVFSQQRDYIERLIPKPEPALAAATSGASDSTCA